ncbi:WD40 repeat domain-containing protein [Planctomycetota bacterium]
MLQGHVFADEPTSKPLILRQFSGRLGCYSSTGQFLAFVDSRNSLQIEAVRKQQAIDTEQVERLLASLDSERFHERNEAFRQLKQMGGLIGSQLDAWQARRDENSLEVNERLRALRDSIMYSAISVSKGNIRRLAISPNEVFVAVGGNDRIVTLWRAASRQQELVITAFDSTIHSLAFSADSNLLAIGTGNGGIFVYNIQRQLMSEPLLGHDSAVLDIAFGPDQRTLYSSGGSDKRVGVWTVTDNSGGAKKQKHVGWLNGHEDVVRCLAVSPDGKRVVSGGYDRDLMIWDTTSMSSVGRLTGHTSTVRSISFVGKGPHFLSASDDGTVRLWSLDASKSLAMLDPGIDSLQRVSLHPRLNRLAVSGDSNRLLSLEWNALQKIAR